ncbi:hypothetical protein KCP69_15330 [Salmonella enterica subsp. enterica]|nr:hypothetical protein KCP69_15330 [Salmonella enterica subsp. enterica]
MLARLRYIRGKANKRTRIKCLQGRARYAACAAFRALTTILLLCTGRFSSMVVAICYRSPPPILNARNWRHMDSYGSRSVCAALHYDGSGSQRGMWRFPACVKPPDSAVEPYCIKRRPSCKALLPPCPRDETTDGLADAGDFTCLSIKSS